jgi:hypothetical protein
MFFEHLPRLIAVSKIFNASLERDASIWGVAASFVSCAPQLESALVKWSAVVGSVMTSPELASTSSSCSSSRNSSLSSSSASSPLSQSSASSLPSVKPRARASSSQSIYGGGRASREQGQGQQLLSSPVTTVHSRSLATTVSEDGHHHTSGSSSTSRPSRSLTHISGGGGYLTRWKRSSAPPGPHIHEGGISISTSSATRTPSPATTSHSSSFAVPPSKGLTLQDIAIMPTQRVARYVMLYQDLLKTTPATSRSYPVVSEARVCALRIAKSCNEAQRNLNLVST